MDGSQRDRRFAWIALFARGTLGLLFFMVGWEKVFRMGPVGHARRLFVEPYAETWIPSALLWAFGTAIPVFELAAGALLLVGLGVRQVAIGVGALLLLVTYGHLLVEPFFDVTTHIFPRLVLVFVVLALHEHDPWRLETRLERR
ncbi:MAG: DoxX family membrane protein [Gemmatimonadota bacterium]|nr:DoxX family membrane protein [Gemmatimonadota bacterium]